MEDVRQPRAIHALTNKHLSADSPSRTLASIPTSNSKHEVQLINNKEQEGSSHSRSLRLEILHSSFVEMPRQTHRLSLSTNRHMVRSCSPRRRKLAHSKQHHRQICEVLPIQLLKMASSRRQLHTARHRSTSPTLSISNKQINKKRAMKTITLSSAEWQTRAKTRRTGQRTICSTTNTTAICSIHQVSRK